MSQKPQATTPVQQKSVIYFCHYYFCLTGGSHEQDMQMGEDGAGSVHATTDGSAGKALKTSHQQPHCHHPRSALVTVSPQQEEQYHQYMIYEVQNLFSQTSVRQANNKLSLIIKLDNVMI